MQGTRPLAVFFARFPAVLAGGLVLAACSNARLVSARDDSTSAIARPAIVHVADFELGSDAVHSQSLSSIMPLHARLEREKAQSLAAALDRAIVADLQKKGIAAERLSAAQPTPSRGWLVNGLITKVDEGNRIARAVIGFGTGATDIQVSTSIEQLAANTAPASLYRLQTDATSGRLPGAAVTLNPYVAAAKFVIDGRDLDHGIYETAQKIADEIARRIKVAPG